MPEHAVVLDVNPVIYAVTAVAVMVAAGLILSATLERISGWLGLETDYGDSS